MRKELQMHSVLADLRSAIETRGPYLGLNTLNCGATQLESSRDATPFGDVTLHVADGDIEGTIDGDGDTLLAMIVGAESAESFTNTFFSKCVCESRGEYDWDRLVALGSR